MKPRSPFIQPFEQLPEQLPLYVLENALLPGGELPLELASSEDLELFFHAIRTNQLIGMIQPQTGNPTGISPGNTYKTGCAGRIRQYRERKDGHLNVMLTGVCRYRLIEPVEHGQRFILARVNWSGFENDYQTEEVAAETVNDFNAALRDYFDRHQMQADWDVLNKLPIEQVVNNLVLIMNLVKDEKQRLLESQTVGERLQLFAQILQNKADPIVTAPNTSTAVN